MASRKKQRKQANATRKTRQRRAGPFRHPDGDRRRRGAMTVEEALAQKRALQGLDGRSPHADEEE